MALKDRVRELIWEWDPMEFGELRADIPDEYDGLSAKTIDQLSIGADPSEVAASLCFELAHDWSGVATSEAESFESALLPGAKRFVGEVARAVEDSAR